MKHPFPTSSAPPPSPAPVKMKLSLVVHQCNECDFKCNVKQDLKRHRMYHDAKSIYQCPWCSFSANFSAYLTRHVKKHHSKIDRRVFARKQLVKTNSAQSLSKKRTEQWQYPTCGLKKNNNNFGGYCGYKSLTKLSLNAHMKPVHPFSTPVLRPHTTKKEKYQFHCAHCPFKTNKKEKFELHDAHHRDQSALYQCQLCSFSTNNRGSLTLHSKIHYREIDCNDNNNIDSLYAEIKTENNVTAGSPMNGQKHAKRALPFSPRSSLPSRPIKRRKLHHPREKSDLKVSEVAYQPEEDPSCPSPDETREEWCISPGGTRPRYISCGDCEYRTTFRSNLKRHARTQHSSSTTAIPADLLKAVTAANQNGLNQELIKKEDSEVKLETEEDVPIESTVSDFSTVVLEQHYHVNELVLKPSLKVEVMDWNSEKMMLRKKKEKGDSFKCLECHYSTPFQWNMKKHKKSHRIGNGKIKCPYCSFSSNARSNLDRHFKYGHHRLLKTKTPSRNQLIDDSRGLTPEGTIEEWYVSPSGNRLRYIYCGDCEYRTTSRLNINRHARKMHPSSTTAIPAKRPKEARLARQNHPGKEDSKVNPEKVEVSIEPAVSDSDFSALVDDSRHSSLNESARNQQNQTPSSQVEVMDWIIGKKVLVRKKKKSHPFKCLECDYSSTIKSNLARHKKGHQANGTFKCSLCSFSSNFRHPLIIHLRHGHHRTLKTVETPALNQLVDDTLCVPPEETREERYVSPSETRPEGTREEWYIRSSGQRQRFIYCEHCNYRTVSRPHFRTHMERVHPSSSKADRDLNVIATSARFKEVQLEARLRNQFGIKECRVVLHDLLSLFVKVVNPENAETLPLNEEENQLDGDEGLKEVNLKIQLLQIQMNTMEERARSADEKVKEFSSKKTDVQKRIEDIAERRALIEYNLLLEQRNLLEMQLTALDTEEEPSEILKQSVEEEIESFEDKINVMDGELRALKEEEESLTQDLEEAQGSHLGAIRVLEAIRSELNALLLMNSV